MVNRSLPTNTRCARGASLPMRLYEDAKHAGQWNPSQVDFSQDRADWESLEGKQRLPILALTVLAGTFLRAQMSHNAVMSVAISKHGSFEDNLCFSSIMAETARYAEVYTVAMQETIPLVGDPDRFFTPQFRDYFDPHLNDVYDRLSQAPEPRNLVETLTYYGPIGKNVLAGTGIHVLRSMLSGLDIMPQMRATLAREEEAVERHGRFSTHLVGNLVRQDRSRWTVVEETMNRSFEPTIGVYREFCERYTPPIITRAEAVTYAVEQFATSYERLEAERGSPAGRADSLLPPR